MAKKMPFEVIDVSEVQTSPRGRRATFDSTLVELFRNLDEDKAVKLNEVPNADMDNHSSVRYVIRKNWRHARQDEPRIIFSEDGKPQVLVKH